MGGGDQGSGSLGIWGGLSLGPSDFELWLLGWESWEHHAQEGDVASIQLQASSVGSG